MITKDVCLEVFETIGLVEDNERYQIMEAFLKSFERNIEGQKLISLHKLLCGILLLTKDNNNEKLT
jgi:hypothetical protein